VSVSAADPKALGGNRLVVTYAYRLGARNESYEQMYMEDKEIARGHNVKWETTPTVVQKVFAAKDLPAVFEIDVPTAKDKYPAYPRMMFVRREIIGPDQKPLPPPEGATAPKMGPNDELKTLPSPLTIGLHPPKS
jgi:hypothetical protein